MKNSIHISVEFEFIIVLNKCQFLRPNLGCVQDVEFKIILLLLGNQLHIKYSVEELTRINRVRKIPAVEVRILTTDLQSLISY